MKKFISTLSSSLVCLILSACATNTYNHTQSDTTDLTIENYDDDSNQIPESSYVSTTPSETISVKKENNIPAYFAQPNYASSIEIETSQSEDSNYSDYEEDTEENNEDDYEEEIDYIDYEENSDNSPLYNDDENEEEEEEEKEDNSDIEEEEEYFEPTSTSENDDGEETEEEEETNSQTNTDIFISIDIDEDLNNPEDTENTEDNDATNLNENSDSDNDDNEYEDSEDEDVDDEAEVEIEEENDEETNSNDIFESENDDKNEDIYDNAKQNIFTATNIPTTVSGTTSQRNVHYTKTTTYSSIDSTGTKRPIKKKKTVETYITNSGKQVQSKEFDETVNTDALKLPEFERERVEVKTVLVKPVVNTMYDAQPITNKQAKILAENIEDEDVIIQEEKYKDPSLKHLIENYTNITKTSSVCCVSNLAAKLKGVGVNSENILNILKNDARNFYVQNTCLILSNEDIDDVFGQNGLSQIVKDTRKSCICANKGFIRKNIASFYKIYNQDPDFYKKALLYRYKDNQGRITEHDINETVLNIALTLEECPN